MLEIAGHILVYTDIPTMNIHISLKCHAIYSTQMCAKLGLKRLYIQIICILKYCRYKKFYTIIIQALSLAVLVL